MGRRDKNKDYDLTKMHEEELRIDSQRTNMNVNPYNEYPNYGYIPVEQSETKIDSRLTQSELHVPRHSKEHASSLNKKPKKREIEVDPEIKKSKRKRTLKTIYRIILMLVIVCLLTFLVLGIMSLLK